MEGQPWFWEAHSYMPSGKNLFTFTWVVSVPRFAMWMAASSWRLMWQTHQAEVVIPRDHMGCGSECEVLWANVPLSLFWAKLLLLAANNQRHRILAPGFGMENSDFKGFPSEFTLWDGGWPAWKLEPIFYNDLSDAFSSPQHRMYCHQLKYRPELTYNPEIGERHEKWVQLTPVFHFFYSQREEHKAWCTLSSLPGTCYLPQQPRVGGPPHSHLNSIIRKTSLDPPQLCFHSTDIFPS